MAGMIGPGLEETVEFCQAEMQWKVKDKNKQQQQKMMQITEMKRHIMFKKGEVLSVLFPRHVIWRRVDEQCWNQEKYCHVSSIW